jgi:hypothetical protein
MKQASLKLRITTIVALLSFCIMTLSTTGAMAQSTDKKVPHSLNAYVQGTDTAGDVLTGVVTITSFINQNNQLFAQGTLNGTLTSATGTVTPISNQGVTLPVSGVDPSCQILNLTLGPLDLNLLGLVIHLNQVVLNINAVPGSGNLLGNLLCAVANLLNGGGTLSGLLTQLTSLLNQILGAL